MCLREARMRFDEVFTKLAHKRLALVDLPGVASNQHELNGTAALRAFFEGSVEQGPVTWLRFAEDADPQAETGSFTFYDARAKSFAKTGRSEWRLYYTGEPLAGSRAGDLLVLAETVDGSLYAMAFAAGSGWERAARQLFPIDAEIQQLQCVDTDVLKSSELDLVRRSILEQLGFDFVLHEQEAATDIVMRNFGLAFPSTAEMGEIARGSVELDSPDPDEVLLAWMDMEEQLFRALERLIVAERIETGFRDVDEFLAFSLSVQNRRKSRMGHAFEHHLAALFESVGLLFDRQVRTEGNRTADFVFPGAAEYRDAHFPQDRLTILAAKTTCKDRWPQVLADADRVSVKHLATLDSTLSGLQLSDMLARSVIPVIPSAIREGYSGDANFPKILDVGGFISLVGLTQQR
jgi:hypothetical protein